MSPGRCGPRPGCEGCDLGHQLRPAQERGGAAQNGICHIIHIYIYVMMMMMMMSMISHGFPTTVCRIVMTGIMIMGLNEGYNEGCTGGCGR